MNSHRIETSIPIGLGTLPYNAIAANLPDLKSDQHFWDSEPLMKKMIMMKMRVVVVVAMMMMIIPAPEGKRPAFWNWEFFELQ